MSKETTFTFKYNDKEYTLPAINKLPNGVLRKTRHIEDEVDKAYSIVEILLEKQPETLEAFDDMTVEEFIAIITEWTQGASLGES